jgi:putative redox protein
MTIITVDTLPESESAGGFRHSLQVGAHQLYTDLPATLGGQDTAPSPHDYFDAALASCKALTVKLYAQRKGIPLTGLQVAVEHDASQEQKGRYGITVKLTFTGPLSDAQREDLLRVADRCPVHKLMTSAEIAIATQLVDSQ